MTYLLRESKFKEVRKKIIKLIKVPNFVTASLKHSNLGQNLDDEEKKVVLQEF